jgi:hypothetical protein
MYGTVCTYDVFVQVQGIQSLSRLSEEFSTVFS